jgi:hypothetical protein
MFFKILSIKTRKHENDKVKLELTIADVCFQSGYQNMTHFNNFFKKLTRKTPCQYRKECFNYGYEGHQGYHSKLVRNKKMIFCFVRWVRYFSGILTICCKSEPFKLYKTKIKDHHKC